MLRVRKFEILISVIGKGQILLKKMIRHGKSLLIYIFFYFRAPHLGRELVCKENKKTFKATIAMSQEFPLGIQS